MISVKFPLAERKKVMKHTLLQEILEVTNEENYITKLGWSSLYQHILFLLTSPAVYNL